MRAATWGFKYEDNTRGGTLIITRIFTTSSSSTPTLYSAQFQPAEPGSDMRGFGATEQDAIVDLFRSERDLVRLAGRPLPDLPGEED